jgi:hypothetical protein
VKLCWFASALVSLVFSLFAGTPVDAVSVKAQPLLYDAALAEGERKKGFIDISNPSSSTIKLKTSVQAFRQIDNDGNLAFYDDDQVAAGIIPDLTEFDLGPRQVMRMYFLLDGTKLPSGDVFGALFVTTDNEQTQGAAQAVRVGTLFTLTNGTAAARNAQVTQLQANFFQFGDQVTGSYQIKNIDNPDKKTGFRPKVMVQLEPWGDKAAHEGALVSAGITRTNNFMVGSDTLGIYKLSVQYQDSKREQWVLVVTGVWRYVLGGALGGLIVGLGTFALARIYGRRNS